MKIIAMIPARIGSKRVPKKNLRLIDGQPLISYILDTVLQANVFDEIYLNSDDLIFENIAKSKGVKFYHRSEWLGGDEITNDQFALDFIENTSGDVLIQILPTSPLLSVKEIKGFVDEMQKNCYDSMISVEHKQIACLFEKKPLNFDPMKPNPPSQTMDPVKVYATALMGWTYKSFINNMASYGCAYHGCDKNNGFYELRGLSTIDIDREEDFLLVESIIKSRKDAISAPAAKYYEEKNSFHSESHVESILKKDGIENNNLYEVNKEVVSIEKIYNEMGLGKSWSKRLIDTENNSVTVISQKPGEGNRKHFHPDWNEWWYILDGKWEWWIEGEKRIVEKGDVVFMKKGRVHKITAVGDKAAVRIAVSRADVSHVYPRDMT